MAEPATADTLPFRQSIEGLFTPRYEQYDLKVIGLPFRAVRILIDGQPAPGEPVWDEAGCLRIRAHKNFSEIQLLDNHSQH